MNGGRINIGEPLRDYRGVLTGVPEKKPRAVSEPARSSASSAGCWFSRPIGKDAALVEADAAQGRRRRASRAPISTAWRASSSAARAAILVAEEALAAATAACSS